MQLEEPVFLMFLCFNCRCVYFFVADKNIVYCFVTVKIAEHT